MICRVDRLTTWCAAVVLLSGLSSTASAQGFTGRIDVTVADATGGWLPGVTVDLTGPVNQFQMTDAQGRAHFLDLPVGTYAMKASVAGFNTYTNNEVVVASGAATRVMIRLAAAGAADTVEAVAATALLDVKRETTTTNVTLEELQNIPSARDPWVVLQTVPTIYVDRVNVGGSESGQQSVYRGKGAFGTDNTWSLDGVPITDMGATGSTPTFFDFDMFQEISITTGGADAQNPTPGVQLNLVLKKGTNSAHANLRYLFGDERLQGNNMDPTLARVVGSDSGLALGGSSPDCVNSNYTRHCGNRTDKYQDYGFDLGGPLFEDKMWIWGTIGKTNPRIRTLTGTLDETILKNYAFKADAQAHSSIRTNFTFFEGNKEKSGRDAGPKRPQETTYDESGPTKYYKGEGNFIAGQNLFVAARYAYIDSRFRLVPQGGVERNFYQDDDNVWHNSYYFHKGTRPQYFAGGDGSYFAGRHEITFGFSWRKTPVESQSMASGNRIITIWNRYPNLIAQAQMDYVASAVGRYMRGFATDTISLDRLTVIIGARYDRQTSSLGASTVPAVPNFPLLPAVMTSPVENAYKFTNVTPRVGITYAADESRKTIARASYAMFASQLPGDAAAFISTIQPSTYIDYNAVDRTTTGAPCTVIGQNGCNGIADLNEIRFDQGVIEWNNVDLSRPGVFTTDNRIGSISAPRTHELMAGVDRELMPNFAVSATFTYRYMNNFLWNPRNGATQANYVQTGVFAGTFANVGAVSIPYYGATSALPGYNAQNRPGYHRRYLGFEISATKRLSNRWMGRFGFASTSFNEYFDSPAAILDRTPTPVESGQYVNYQAAGPLVNGGPVVERSPGNGRSSIYLLPPKYQLSANGMYQGPWGINFGANLVFRQGYGEPFFRSRVGTRDPVLPIKTILLAKGPDQFRLDPVTSLDVRAEWMPTKIFKAGPANFAVDFDVFNLFNRATVLGLDYDARLSTYGNLQEIMQPRIARIGLRFFF